jgi:hypothetical protein
LSLDGQNLYFIILRLENGMIKLNGTNQFLIYANDENLSGENINITTKIQKLY